MASNDPNPSSTSANKSESVRASPHLITHDPLRYSVMIFMWFYAGEEHLLQNTIM